MRHPTQPMRQRRQLCCWKVRGLERFAMRPTEQRLPCSHSVNAIHVICFLSFFPSGVLVQAKFAICVQMHFLPIFVAIIIEVVLPLTTVSPPEMYV